MEQVVRNLIIGAGPSGLAMAGRLAEKRQPFMLIEKGQHVGEAWHHHYERLHLHTDRQFSGLPHRPIPKTAPTFVPRLDLIQYWEEYARHYKIEPLFGQEVVNISKQGTSWVTTTTTDRFISETITVCTGYNRIPTKPHWPGEARFRGTILHSGDYKNPEPFKNKKVLVVGMGNSGADIALELSQHAAATYISLRSPVNIMTRDVAGKPTQFSAIVMSSILPNWTYDLISRFIQKKVIGDLSAYGIKTPDYSPSAGVRKGRIPVLDIGTVAQVKAGKIKVQRDIEHFIETGVQFIDGTHITVDAVILATGYRALLHDLIPEIRTVLNERGCPDKLWYNEFLGLYFLGFGVPLTGILRGIKLDSKKIVDQLLKGK
jgi:cation diffusion facilitator CzcD-associated flavoprotein CzcO